MGLCSLKEIFYRDWKVRYKDWISQAEADYRHAKISLREKSYEWACFASHQAAEKALKSVFEKNGERVWGHSIHRMLQILEEKKVKIPDEVKEAGKILDKHYITSRYPNGLSEGAPWEVYTQKGAKDANRCAGKILRFCKNLLHE